MYINTRMDKYTVVFSYKSTLASTEKEQTIATLNTTARKQRSQTQEEYPLCDSPDIEIKTGKTSL